MSNMHVTGFISNNQDLSFVIDGAHFKVVSGEDEKTQETEELFVQLRKARTEESGCPWNRFIIQKVTIKNMVVHDETDVGCLMWFIAKKVKIIFDSSRVTPNAAPLLIKQLQGEKVQKGSTITICHEGGYSGYFRSEDLRIACEAAGFIVN